MSWIILSEPFTRPNKIRRLKIRSLTYFQTISKGSKVVSIVGAVAAKAVKIMHASTITTP